MKTLHYGNLEICIIILFTWLAFVETYIMQKIVKVPLINIKMAGVVDIAYFDFPQKTRSIIFLFR